MKNLKKTKIIIGMRVIKNRFKGILILNQVSYVY